MKVGLVSLGCSRTLVDSEVALGGLKQHGFDIVSDVSKADVGVVNTCGFIQEAKEESIEAVLELCKLKKQGKLKAVVVLGCMAQLHGEELRKELGDEVDGIIGTDSYGSLAELLKPLQKKHDMIYEVKAKPRFLLDERTPRVTLTPQHYAYVKISEGCLNACSYCVIPKMKGPHRSRSIDSIVAEIRRISDERGVSEIDLIGQDTAAYGMDTEGRFMLPELLRAAATAAPVPWLRLLYAHPGHVSEAIIDAIAAHPNICKYVDFPIEHSHDAMLKRMNRGVDRKKMEWGMRRLRERIPGVAIRTTVIVGFPGETQEEFDDLLSFIQEHRFERLGAFKYSNEAQAKSFTMPDHISEELKEERFRRVMELQRDISEEIHSGFVGRTLRVLIDEKQKGSAGVWIGRTEMDAPEVDGEVTVRSAQPLKAGDFVNVRITGATEYDLEGDAA